MSSMMDSVKDTVASAADSLGLHQTEKDVHKAGEKAHGEAAHGQKEQAKGEAKQGVSHALHAGGSKADDKDYESKSSWEAGKDAMKSAAGSAQSAMHQKKEEMGDKMDKNKAEAKDKTHDTRSAAANKIDPNTH